MKWTTIIDWKTQRVIVEHETIGLIGTISFSERTLAQAIKESAAMVVEYLNEAGSL